MKVLIIQTAFIGDVVLATPLIEAVKTKYPDCTIDFLLRRGNENLLEEDTRLRHVLIWDKKNGKYKSLLQLLARVRREKYDLLFNLQRFGATGFLTWLSGARERVGFRKNPFSFSYSKKVDHVIGHGSHEVDRNLSLIGTPQTLRPSLILSRAHLERVRGYKRAPYLVIAPTSVWFTKQFPEHKWIAFLKRVSFDGAIYLVGGPGDFEACERIRIASGKGHNLCGELSLMESAALMKDATMNYVNDSAPMHFASAVNAPTCAIYCSTVPSFGFGPLADRAVVVEVDEALSCRPCGLHGKKTCPEGHFDCANKIDVRRLADVI